MKWHKVAEVDSLKEGRVRSVVINNKTIALTKYKNKYGALDNACPHQGGPLSEGSIEKGYLRCPWHGWDFCPHSGKSPGSHDDGIDTYPVEERKDGIYIQLKDKPEHKKTISDLMVETLSNWGIDTVFGMVGHSNLGFASALELQEKNKKIKFFGIRHEGAAAFACSGYAKTINKPAACFTIAGPGATNLLTGLWDAKVDRAPVLALTGQVNTQVLGPGAFQEIDLLSAFDAVSTFSQTVLNSSNQVELVNLAVKNAILKRDVSHLILPDEVQTLEAKENQKAGSPKGRLPNMKIAPATESLNAAIETIKKSKRPLIIVGYGARNFMTDIIKYAETLNAAVITTFKAKGQISDTHPLAGGVLGRSGTPVASWLMNESDLLIVLGSSFSNHTGITAKKTIVQVDFDPMQIGKFHPVDIPVLGDIGVVVKSLTKVTESKNVDVKKEVSERWDIWKAEKASRAKDDRKKGVASAALFKTLQEKIPEDAVIPVDVGNNAYSFGRYFECKKQTILMSGYLGSIGFAFPAAMGAWAAVKGKRKVVSISGDGGFGQYMNELTTAVKYKMNITHILLNNSELGKISKEQLAGEWNVWQTSLHNPNFAKYAENCGALGIQVNNINELDSALEKALKYTQGPSLIEVITDSKLI
ncbi:MAG: Rieske 2Fe-2S domain-containing protein [Bdellovibrionales bacterium]|nr:Rieske 2Fe-2S domain-containing protein [Bdellovibrionales bacterium]